MEFQSNIKTIEWSDDCSKMINQTLLPYEFKITEVRTAEQMYSAIKNMIVRGAPAIGIAGAHGVALAACELSKSIDNKEVFLNELQKKSEYINSSRPTAVNLTLQVLYRIL